MLHSRRQLPTIGCCIHLPAGVDPTNRIGAPVDGSSGPFWGPRRRLQRPVLGSPSTAPAARFGVPVDGSNRPFWGPRRRRMLHPLTARRGGG